MSDQPIAYIEVHAPYEEDDWTMFVNARFELFADGQLVEENLELTRDLYILRRVDHPALFKRARSYAESLITRTEASRG